MDYVYNFIENLNIKAEYIVAAISGGPDSMFLLKILLNINNKLNKKIVVAHVHHNLRKESDTEAILLKKFCEENNIIFEMMKIEKYPNNKFSEEVARNIRYKFFDKIINKYKSDILFTAHHGDDLMETILMRLTRGSNFKGYAGFESISKRNGYIIARPLIYLTKQEIEDNLQNDWYAIDKTNLDEKYKRNRIRKKILPILKEENINVHHKFLNFSETIIMTNNYIEKQMLNIKDEIIVNNSIDIYKFNNLDDIIKIYLLEYYLKENFKDNIKCLTNKHVNIILNLLLRDSNSKVCLPCNKIGISEYNRFKIIDKLVNNSYDYTFDKHIDLPNGKEIIVDNNTQDGSNFVIHLNTKDIKLPLHVRCKKDGDYMCVKNLEGKKSISNIFTDAKVSKEIRDSYPIVTDDSGVILWVPGIKKSNFDRKKDKNYDIILKYY